MSRHLSARLQVVVLLASGLAGCGPNLKAPDGTRVSLRQYDSVNVKSVELDPNLPYPGLPRQLSGAIYGKLYLSKMWLQSSPRDTQISLFGVAGVVGGGSKDTGTRPADLRVVILSAHYPSKAARVLIGAANTMKCRMEVLDPRAGSLLGSAEVSASKGPATHGALGSGATGVVVNLLTDNPDIYDLMLNDAMAGAIAQVLDRAKKYEPPNPPTPKANATP